MTAVAFAMGKLHHLVLIISVHIGCVAVGLCWHYYATALTTHQRVEEDAWSDLTADGERLLHKLKGIELGRPTSRRAGLDWRAPVFIGGCPPPAGIIITDPDWRVVCRLLDDGRVASPDLAGGEVMAWTPASVGESHTGKPVRGTLALADGPHMALACPLDNPKGYLLLHQPEAKIEAKSAALTKLHPWISVTALLWSCVPLSIAAYMIVRRFHDRVVRDRETANANILRHIHSVVRTRDAVVFGLAKLADSRDADTGQHLERICEYSRLLASALRGHPKFRDEVTPAFIGLIGISSALHDIGKVGVSDKVLRKDGLLNADESAHMRLHPTIGGECLREIERHLGSSNFLQMAREISLSHHERWDGSGYPKGLVGEAIPLAARIVALVDVYDALSSRRVYKEPLPLDACAAAIRNGAGKQFDPDLVESWSAIEPRFREIAQRYRTATAKRQEAEDTRRPIAARGGCALASGAPGWVSGSV
jgi:response regulator RpfG family c-di-GMP phosphodiesterase